MGAKMIKIKGLVYPPLSPISNDICKISKHKKERFAAQIIFYLHDLKDNRLSPRLEEVRSLQPMKRGLQILLYQRNIVLHLK